MKKELREIYDFGQLEIITEKSKLPKYALAKLSYSFARADSKNANHRTYPESLLSREIDRKSEELRKGKIAGQLEHPLSGITKLDKVAHVLNSVFYDRTTKLASAESFVLDTSKGRDFMVMLEAELKMGCSMRGFGNVFNGIVQSDYKFDTCDFVLHPSFGSDAVLDKSNIVESANNIFNEKGNKDKEMKNMMGLTENYVTEMMELVYGVYVKDEGFKGTLEDFKKEHGNIVLAEILVAEGKCEDTETALKHLGVKKEIIKIPVAPIRKKVTAGEVYLEAKIAGIDPADYAEKLNKNAELQAESDSDLSPREIRSALEEGRQMGIDMSDESERKKILDIFRKQKTQKVITEDEKAKIVADRTGSTVQLVKEVWAIEKKKKAEERKKAGKINLSVKEGIASGFGQETRPESRRISKKILDKE